MAEVMRLLDDSDDGALLMSRKSCHARNVSSIVIRDDGGSLTRVFLAFPGHELVSNHPGGKFVVGIHNHLYPITLTRILGEVTNHIFRPGPSGERYKHYRFFSGITGTGAAVEHGHERLRWNGGVQVTEEPTSLPAQTLHTISTSEKAAWLVQEGKRCRDYTDLYTNEEINLDGLYEPFGSVEEVIEHVIEFDAA